MEKDFFFNPVANGRKKHVPPRVVARAIKAAMKDAPTCATQYASKYGVESCGGRACVRVTISFDSGFGFRLSGWFLPFDFCTGFWGIIIF